MPWLPELFSAPALAHVLEVDRRERLRVIPFFPGLMTGETSALIESFAGVPELHHPVRGRIKGVAAFERYAHATNAWLAERNATVEDVNFVFASGRGIEETLLHLDGDTGRIELPIAIATDQHIGLDVCAPRPAGAVHELGPHAVSLLAKARQMVAGVHEDITAGPGENAGGGWDWILSDLKSLLETGEILVPAP